MLRQNSWYWFYSCVREALLRRIGYRVKRLSTHGTDCHTPTVIHFMSAQTVRHRYWHCWYSQTHRHWYPDIDVRHWLRNIDIHVVSGRQSSTYTKTTTFSHPLIPRRPPSLIHWYQDDHLLSSTDTKTTTFSQTLIPRRPPSLIHWYQDDHLLSDTDILKQLLIFQYKYPVAGKPKCLQCI